MSTAHPGDLVNSWTQLRQTNLAHLAGTIHDFGPLSRAELTRRSGLNRVTVLDMIADLQARGIVEETSPQLTGRAGRPTKQLRIGGDRYAVATVEIRPTRVRVHLASVGGETLAEASVRIGGGSQGSPAIVEEAARLLRQISGTAQGAGRVIAQVAVGCAGLLDRGNGTILSSEYLGWTDEPLLDRLCQLTDLERWRFSLGRLSNLAMKAESFEREAIGEAGIVMLYTDIGVGVSGAVRQKERALEGEFDPGAQFAHLIVERDGLPCFCGRRGCLEQYAGAIPFLKRLGPAAEGLDESGIDALIASGDERVAEAAREQGVWLARLIDSITVTLGVREFVLGGLFSPLTPYLIESITGELNVLHPLRGGPAPNVRASQFGREGVLNGGAAESIRAVVTAPSALAPVSEGTVDSA